MAFQTDYSEVSEGFDVLPEGEYECIIKYAGEDATRGGTVYMGVTLVVRNDIDQKGKNAYIWHHIWQRKEPTPADNACGGYSSKQIQSLSKAAHLPNGKKYETLSDWADELKNKVVRVTVEHDEYQGKTNVKVKWVNESRVPECKHQWKTANQSVPTEETAPAQDGFEEVSPMVDDDLPF